MHKYQQVNFFSNVVKSVRPIYGNKEELATLSGRVIQLVPPLSDTENYWGFQGYSPFHERYNKPVILEIGLKIRHSFKMCRPSSRYIIE